MKKVFLAMVTCLTLMSCTKSPQKLAEESVQFYLKMNSNNPKSYESIAFGELDTIYTKFYNSPLFTQYFKDYKEVKKKYNSTKFDVEYYSGKTDGSKWMNDYYKNRLEAATKNHAINVINYNNALLKIDSLKTNFKTEINYYEIAHSYRGS